MKFCPKCGTPRSANFCSNCGFGFLSESEKPSNSTKMVGLEYGPAYQEGKNCDNCGQAKANLSKCDVCEQRDFNS